ncbi:MAG: anti-sigma factor [Terriglobia bacterium]
MNTNIFQSRECARIREQLDAYLSNELLVETTGEVLKHLEGCVACSRELEARMRVREALRKAVAKQLPPEHLAVSIRGSLRKASRPFVSFWQAPSWTLALAGLAFIVIVGAAGQQWLKVRHGREAIARVLTLGVTDHLQCAIREHNYPEAANPPDWLRQKLGPKYSGLLPVVEARLAGFQLLEAHICAVSGSPRKYVHFIARGRGTILSVILTKREGESLPSGRILVAGTSGDVDLYKARLEGMSVAGFESKEYFGFVVSDLGQEELVRLAGGLAPPLRDALNAAAETAAFPATFAVSFLTDYPESVGRNGLE